MISLPFAPLLCCGLYFQMHVGNNFRRGLSVHQDSPYSEHVKLGGDDEGVIMEGLHVGNVFFKRVDFDLLPTCTVIESVMYTSRAPHFSPPVVILLDMTHMVPFLYWEELVYG